MQVPEGSLTQVAYVVRDVEASAARWTNATGAGPWFLLEPETKGTLYRGNLAHDRYRLGMGFVGTTLIELIQPMDSEPSVLNEVLAERGEGFHHVCPHLAALAGAAFDERCHELEGKGLKLAMSTEIVGLGRAAFYDAKSTIGGFIEVFELGQGYAVVPLMAELHAGWDGIDPIRQMQTLFGKGV